MECRLERPLKVVPLCIVQFKIRNTGLRQKRTCQHHPSVCQTVTSVKHLCLSARHRNTLSKSSLCTTQIGSLRSSAHPTLSHKVSLLADIDKSRNYVGLSACYTPWVAVCMHPWYTHRTLLDCIGHNGDSCSLKPIGFHQLVFACTESFYIKKKTTRHGEKHHVLLFLFQALLRVRSLNHSHHYPRADRNCHQPG